MTISYLKESIRQRTKRKVSSLCSGLLTIGPRFGGALDEAAKMFAEAADMGVDAKKWVTDMKKENKLIMGIGHRIKSKTNPDTRVEVPFGKRLHFLPLVEGICEMQTQYH